MSSIDLVILYTVVFPLISAISIGLLVGSYTIRRRCYASVREEVRRIHQKRWPRYDQWLAEREIARSRKSCRALLRVRLIAGWLQPGLCIMSAGCLVPVVMLFVGLIVSI